VNRNLIAQARQQQPFSIFSKLSFARIQRSSILEVKKMLAVPKTGSLAVMLMLPLGIRLRLLQLKASAMSIQIASRRVNYLVAAKVSNSERAYAWA